VIIKGCVVGVLAAVMLTGIPSRGETQEQEVAADGQREYQQSCAICHGPGGKGGNSMKNQNFLNITPADLTRLRTRNKGQFPFWRVYDVIDGRLEVRGHGTREMPIWGYAFQAEEGYRLGSETRAVGRILSLVIYLQSIQTK
jgi:mono/diheme cytochrome c family protein